VDPTTSAKSAVTGRSSSALAGGEGPTSSACLAPHDGQNRAPGGTVAPHAKQGTSATDDIGPKIYPAPVGERRRKPQGKVARWFERVALGTIMGAVAWLVERRMMKVLKRRGEEPPTSAARPRAELSATPEQVRQQPDRQR